MPSNLNPAFFTRPVVNVVATSAAFVFEPAPNVLITVNAVDCFRYSFAASVQGRFASTSPNLSAKSSIFATVIGTNAGPR